MNIGIYGPEPYEIKWKIVIHGPEPYEFIEEVAIHGPKPYEFIGKLGQNRQTNAATNVQKLPNIFVSNPLKPF